jgi:hypothetical protein
MPGCRLNAFVLPFAAVLLTIGDNMTREQATTNCYLGWKWGVAGCLMYAVCPYVALYPLYYLDGLEAVSVFVVGLALGCVGLRLMTMSR